MKRGKMSKSEKTFVRENADKLSVEEMSKRLSRTESSIQNVLNKMEPESQPRNEKVTPVYQGTRAGDMMARKVRNGKVSSTIMTEAASEQADEHRKSVKTTRHTEDSVYKPLGKAKFDDKGNIKRG